MESSDTAEREKSGYDRDQELMWTARQHPSNLILPDVYPTRFPGTWVAIFEGTLPMDQVHGLRMEGFGLYKRVTACPNGNIQVIIREDTHPDREGSVQSDKVDERYEQYEHPGRPDVYL